MNEPKPKYILMEKTKALYTMLQPQLDQFPKNAKFTLRARIEDSILDVMRLLVVQNYRQTDEERAEAMLDAIANINLLNILLQQAVVFKYISYGNYEEASGLATEISRIATARHRNLSGGGGKMKTYDKIYGEIISLPNLYRAYREARRGKTDSTFMEFSKDMHGNLWKLHEELLGMGYKPSPYSTFHVNDYKERRIMAPHFRDHVVHHAIYNYLEPIYDRCFIHDSFACRKGKGTHRAFLRLRKFMNKYRPDDYFMKCDITKYFYSIDQQKLMEIIGRKIRDERLLWLIGKIVRSHGEEPLPHHIPNPENKEQRKGIPIGNLTSQLFANIYMNELDQFIKHRLKVRHYIRYVDDFVILAKNKDVAERRSLSDICRSDPVAPPHYLHEIWQKIRNFLHDELFLRLEQRKTQINKISFGVDFAGYVAFKRYARVRSRNYRRFRHRLNERIDKYHRGHISFESLNSSFTSYLGHLSHTNSNRIREKIEKLHIKVTASTAGRAVKRGGNWNNGANAGPFCANLNNAPSNTNYNIGFRCCSGPPEDAVLSREGGQPEVQVPYLQQGCKFPEPSARWIHSISYGLKTGGGAEQQLAVAPPMNLYRNYISCYKQLNSSPELL